MHQPWHQPPTGPPPIAPPAAPPNFVTWCDETNYDADGEPIEGPCMHGLAWWIWLLLILGVVLCIAPICWKIRTSAQQGITLRRLLEFWEAVMLANHADPWKARLQGRPMTGMSAIDDLLQAQDCCCCFTLPTGLAILGTIDLGRLAVHLVYAIMNIDIYDQTKGVPGSDPRVLGLMDDDRGYQPNLHKTIIEVCFASIVISGIKVLLWLFTCLTLTCECINPLRVVMIWAPVELLLMIAVSVTCSGLNRDICLVDISIYNATGWHDSGYVGFRRNYLEQLPADRFEALEVRHDGTLKVCEAYWFHELLLLILDCVLCFVLTVYTVYIGHSYSQQVIHGFSGDRRGAASGVRAAGMSGGAKGGLPVAGPGGKVRV